MNAPLNHNALATVQAHDLQSNDAPGFNSMSGWKLANRIGEAFAASTIVPAAYQNNVANCIVALEMANRMGASPLQVMQNLYIVHGNPGWSSKFLVACFNQCGRFSSIRYTWNADKSSCRAWAMEKSTGERIEGPTVTLQMAKDEGWSTKSGSKWKTMPELMLMYRAAAFMIRTYAPEISMGMSTDDELVDITPTNADGSLYVAGKPVVEMPRALETMAPQPTAAASADPATGETTPPPAAAVIDQADAPDVGASAPAAAVPDAQPKTRAPSEPGAMATEGERKFILNRVKSGNLQIHALIEAAGMAGVEIDMSTLEGLTKDQFISLKDNLPSSV